MFSPEPSHRYRELAPRAPEGSFSLDALVPGEGPLELDIGFGRGLSLFARAEESPQSRIVGIEIKTKWAYKVQRRLESEGRERLRVLCGDAREILGRAGPDGSVSRVAVHFPDPWWKKRHGKRRLVGTAFLTDVGRLLRPGGELFVQTDVRDRAERYVQLIRESGAFDLSSKRGFVEEEPHTPRSNRERRAMADGLPVWRIVATRK